MTPNLVDQCGRTNIRGSNYKRGEILKTAIQLVTGPKDIAKIDEVGYKDLSGLAKSLSKAKAGGNRR